jgi:hypothetical protein
MLEGRTADSVTRWSLARNGPPLRLLVTCSSKTSRSPMSLEAKRAVPWSIAAGLFGVLASSLTAMKTLADSLDAPQVTVKSGHLNVTNPQGAATLYVRILLRCSLAECGSPSPRPAPASQRHDYVAISLCQLRLCGSDMSGM